MRAEKTERVRRRLLEAAVADNLETMRGLPPRALRRSRRAWETWARRAPLLLIPITLVASGYMVSNGPRTSAAPVTTAVAPPATVSAPSEPYEAPTTTLAEAVFPAPPLQRVKSAAFPLSVRRIVLDAGHGGTDAGATSSGAATTTSTSPRS